MSYYRSYLNKNNTLLKNSRINTAKNPNTEIYYGNSFSRFIFEVDLTDLKNKIENGDLILNEQTKHYLNFTNTIFGDEYYLGKTNTRNRERASSFDLILFKINEFWDEGVGFNYNELSSTLLGDRTISLTASNWFNKTSLENWTEFGSYTTPEILKTIHFDNGNENIKEDLTDYINTILTGETTDYGLGLSFPLEYESLINTEEKSVAFFTKYTQTFFEPFVESVFYDNIIDDRHTFILEKDNNLYLYVFKNGNPYNLDQIPTVNILDSNKNVIETLTGITSTKIRKGVYSITLNISGDICNGKTFLYDKWTNIFIDGISIEDKIQKFNPKPYSSLYDIGEYEMEDDKYVLQFYGIKLNEKIKRGEQRNIVVSLKSITTRNKVLVDDIFYRLYVREGKVQVNVFDWTLLDKTTENSFILDTSYLIPKEYFIEIKSVQNNQIFIFNDEIKFEIVSEK